MSLLKKLNLYWGGLVVSLGFDDTLSELSWIESVWDEA